MNAICVLFLLCSLSRLSFTSVVFDFNASLNDVAPVSSMKFPVILMRMKDWIVGGYHVCYCFVITLQMEFRECCV